MLKKLTGLVLVFLSLNLWANEIIEVNEPWIREAPPTATVMAAYMNIKNTSDKDLALVSAECDYYETIELHSTIMDGDMARMVKQEKLNLPKGEVVSLQPGGLHIMLIGVKQRPVAGDSVKIVLNFSDETQKEIMAKVKKITGAMPMKHHHHH